MRVVVDAGPVIHLSWVHQLSLIGALFEEAAIPPTVRDETLAAPDGTIGLDDIREALASGLLGVRPVPAGAPGAPVLSVPPALGAGETEAIRLAVATGADLLLTDDGAARRAAVRHSLHVTGTLGVLKAARERQLIESVLPFLLALRRLGFWVSEELVDEVRREEAVAG